MTTQRTRLRYLPLPCPRCKRVRLEATIELLSDRDSTPGDVALTSVVCEKCGFDTRNDDAETAKPNTRDESNDYCSWAAATKHGCQVPLCIPHTHTDEAGVQAWETDGGHNVVPWLPRGLILNMTGGMNVVGTGVKEASESAQ